MYTGQLDIGEGSVPTLVSTAQFLDMPLLEQLLQTHALAATNSPPAPITPKPKINRAPVRANYSVSPAAKKMNRATQRQELLPAGPSRIDLEVKIVTFKADLSTLCLLVYILGWRFCL